MKIARTTSLLAVLMAGALALSACGTDTNTAASSSSTSSGSSSSSDSGVSSGSAMSTDSGVSSGSAMSTDSGVSSGSGTPGSSDSQAMPSSSGGASATFAGSGFACATGELRSSGSTAQGKAIGQWITDYNAKCSATVNDYGGGGSGKGVTDFISNQTDFGGSDSALKDAEHADAKSKRCKGNDAIDLPLVTGPIAVSYNLSGVSKLIMTPKVLAGIFSGTIKTWNDPAITAINPGATLPGDAIATVHRSEDSGTTDNFTKYLTAAGGWTHKGGKGWPQDLKGIGTGAQGSDGVAKAVSTTADAIGYVEWGFAKDNKLAMAQVDNGSGPVELTAQTVGKAVEAAKVVGTGKDLSLKLDYATTQAGAYPVILVTYEIVCSAGNGDKGALLKSFLGYAATDGQGSLTDLGAAPLPTSIQTKVIEAVKGIS